MGSNNRIRCGGTLQPPRDATKPVLRREGPADFEATGIGLCFLRSGYVVLYVRAPDSLLNDSMLTVFPNVAMNPRTECFCQ
jgi:hypothetical protein